MTEDQYLNRVIEDLKARATKVLVNNTVELEISTTESTDTSLKVWTRGLSEVDLITNIKLLDENLEVISERNIELEVYKGQYMSFSFDYEVTRKVMAV